MAITLFKSAKTGMVFRPDDFNGNMGILEDAVNQLQLAAALIPDPSILANKADLINGRVPYSELPDELNGLAAKVDINQSALATVSTAITYDGTIANSGSVMLKKSGGSVSANINLGSVAGFGTSLATVAGTLPTAYRPSEDLIMPALFFNTGIDASAMSIGIVKITSTGLIQAAVSGVNNKMISTQVCWKV